MLDHLIGQNLEAVRNELDATLGDGWGIVTMNGYMLATSGNKHFEVHVVSDDNINWTISKIEPSNVFLPIIKIIEAGRPNKDEDYSFQDPKYQNEFMECDACRAKPGTPTLCKGCLHNREVIGKLKKDG